MSVRAKTPADDSSVRLVVGCPACSRRQGQAAVGRFGLTVCLGEFENLQNCAYRLQQCAMTC